tara:strand:- start:533 stop:796 length:264 start_codon:yes stop_codon:yes gene_type:complete
MATSITNAFITQFEAEVHMAYQRMGSKLKNLVRQVNGVNGNTVKFQKIAKGSANTKARHAEVVAMDLHIQMCQLLLMTFMQQTTLIS